MKDRLCRTAMKALQSDASERTSVARRKVSIRRVRDRLALFNVPLNAICQQFGILGLLKLIIVRSRGVGNGCRERDRDEDIGDKVRNAKS